MTYNACTRILDRALALLAVVGFTAAIGLATFEPAEPNRRDLPTGANARSQVAPPAVPNAAPGHAPTSQPRPGAGELDPVLRRLDFGGAQHG